MTTLTLTARTDQEAFDQVATHLAKMTERSATNKACKYRTSDGNACAIGGIIDTSELTEQQLDDLTNIQCPVQPFIYGKVVWGEPGELGREYSLSIDGVRLGLLTHLQDAHDAPDNWRESGFVGWRYLRSAARVFGLNTDHLNSVVVAKTYGEEIPAAVTA